MRAFITRMVAAGAGRVARAVSEAREAGGSAALFGEGDAGAGFFAQRAKHRRRPGTRRRLKAWSPLKAQRMATLPALNASDGPQAFFEHLDQPSREAA